MTDDDVRWHIYDITMREGAPPLRSRLATLLDASDADIAEALQRLAAARMLALQPGTNEILMAGPFSAVPTPFRVTVDAFSTYGNCIWDAFGIAAMLQKDAEIETSCGDCGTAAHLSVRGNEVFGGGFMHFALPPRVWWQNIVFT